MELKVINFIKNNSNWREILSVDPYNLIIKDDGNFTILKYSQIDSDFNNEIVRECRGLIIDNNLNPVCIPFFKFGNYGESYADLIDWETAKVEEKIDGSLIKVWNYNNKWNVSTNGIIFAENAPLRNDEIVKTSKFDNFLELFNAASESSGLNMASLNPQYTYMFELVSPHNRVVVPYESIDIYHIGTRDNVSLEEIESDIGIKKPKTYDCNRLEDLIEMASYLRYCEEGYVVKDSKYKRIKVKSPAYVAVHRLIGGMNNRRLLDLLRTNEISEFLVYFPEYKSYLDNLSLKINNLASYLTEILKDKIDGVDFKTKKDFALIATKTKYPAFFFNYYEERVKTPTDWIWSMTNDKILENLNRLEE